MSEAILSRGHRAAPTPGGTLALAARFWFLALLTGQWMFVLYIVGFYYTSAIGGDLERWAQVLPDGIIKGDMAGNIALGAHLFVAAIISFGGALQLIPQIRQKAIHIHRWNGRLFIFTAFVMSVSGLYMIWTRGTIGGPVGHITISVNALLMMTCALMALHHVRAGRIDIHRRWALRLLVLASGVWFFRIWLNFWMYIAGGPVGFDPRTFEGPFLTFLYIAVYVGPLVILEVYLRAGESENARIRTATASGLFALTLAMCLGIFMTMTNMWLPRI